MIQQLFNKGGKLDITFDLPSFDKIVRAIVKSGFLYAYSKLGYGFIFTKYGQDLRKIILNNTKPLNHLLINGITSVQNKI